jgi:hypothetical protein
VGMQILFNQRNGITTAEKNDENDTTSVRVGTKAPVFVPDSSKKDHIFQCGEWCSFSRHWNSDGIISLQNIENRQHLEGLLIVDHQNTGLHELTIIIRMCSTPPPLHRFWWLNSFRNISWITTLMHLKNSFTILYIKRSIQDILNMNEILVEIESNLRKSVMNKSWVVNWFEEVGVDIDCHKSMKYSIWKQEMNCQAWIIRSNQLVRSHKWAFIFPISGIHSSTKWRRIVKTIHFHEK